MFKEIATMMHDSNSRYIAEAWILNKENKNETVL